MNEQILDELSEKLKKAGIDGKFSVQVKEACQYAKKKVQDNKDKYFSLQKTILYVSAGVSILNVGVNLAGAVQSLNTLIPFITGASSVCSIIVTVLLAQKETNKYSETWFRHQKHQADMEFEILEYVYQSGSYSGRSEREAAEQFVQNMVNIWRKNQERFENNMSRFDAE